MTGKDPAKHRKANNLTGWSGGTGVPCLLSCIHVHCLLPLREQKNKALLLPSFLFVHILAWSTNLFTVLQLSRLLTLSILGLFSRPDAFLSLHWVFPRQIFHQYLGKTLFSFICLCQRGKKNKILIFPASLEARYPRDTLLANKTQQKSARGFQDSFCLTDERYRCI